MDSWQFIKKMYKDRLGIPEYIVDYMSIELILKMCCMGLSNSRISKKLKLDIYYISNVIFEHFDFDGWNVDLDFSPLAIYNRAEGNYTAYVQEVETISPFNFEKFLNLSFRACRRYNTIRKEIDNYYWEKQNE